MRTSMKLHAQKYHNLGANVVALSTTNGDKRPLHKFKLWFDKRQTSLEFEQLVTSKKQVSVWPYATAIALVCGVNGYRMIDIDACADQGLVEDIVAKLGLPEKYPWVQRSGSGFGIWVRCDVITLPVDLTRSNTPWFVPVSDESPYSHIELRLSRALGVVPPSQHPNGRYYHWLFDSPTTPPLTVDIGTLLHVLFQYGQVERVSSRNPSAPLNHRAVYRDTVFGHIAQRYDLLEVAQRLFPGQTKPAGRDNIRILGYGGLIVNPKRGWYCFADSIGGGLIDLFGYSLFGCGWNRQVNQLYMTRNYAAEMYPGGVR